MGCNTILGITKSCDSNLGGVSKFYINNGDAIDQDSIVITDGEVTTATLDGDADGEFVEFRFNPNTSSYTEAATIDLANGSTVYTQTITLTIPRREALKRQRLLLIAEGQPDLTIIVKDNNGLYWVFGLGPDHFCHLTNDEGGSGVAKADGSNYVLTFTCEDSTRAYEIDEDVVDTLCTAIVGS